MDKIDRLGWADGMSFVSYGVRIGVRVNDPAVLQGVRDRLPPAAKPVSIKTVDHLYSIIGHVNESESRVRRLNLVYWNLSRIARSRKFADALDLFESHLQLTIAEHARTRVFVHAGVVGWNNRAILIPGLSHSGKTTLVDRFIRAGAKYYSDEYAVLDRRGRVHPFARPLGVRSGQSSNQERVAPEDIGAEVGLKPLRVGLVLSTRYDPDARWRPRKLSNGKGVLELMANTVSARSQPETTLKVLPKALECATILKGVRGEADELVAAILSRDFSQA